MATRDLITYSSANKMIETVPSAFAQRQLNVLSWIWRPGINVGARIHDGAELADIQWEDNSREPVAAPAGCSGEIVWRNAAFDYLNLRYVEQPVLKLL